LTTEIPQTIKNELIVHILNLHIVGQVVDVPADLLEIVRGQRDDRVEHRGGNLEVRVIQIQQIQFGYSLRVLLHVLQLNAQMIGVVLIHIQRECVVVVDRLNDLVQVQNVHPDEFLALAMVILELVRFQLQVNQYDVRAVHGAYLDVFLRDLYHRVRKDLLQSFHEDFDRGGLHSLNLQTILFVRGYRHFVKNI
tara:strand:- start:1392 stop:1973 length:582 start_codon:yes stop_codon:yes gene_type:complete